jgi:hypothetical protein
MFHGRGEDINTIHRAEGWTRLAVIPSERSESRDPPKSESVEVSILPGEFGGSFDSALQASLRMTENAG